MPKGKEAMVTHIDWVDLGPHIRLVQRALMRTLFFFQSHLGTQAHYSIGFTSYFDSRSLLCLLQDPKKETSMVLGEQGTGLDYTMRDPRPPIV